MDVVLAGGAATRPENWRKAFQAGFARRDKGAWKMTTASSNTSVASRVLIISWKLRDG
jgi:hypothetical protein